MSLLRFCIILCALAAAALTGGARTPITGASKIDAATMHAFVAEVNPDFDYRIAEAYIRIGERYGIRADIAFCQAIIETGWFRFNDGTAVTPDQNNFCGLGVTRLGVRGHRFATVDDGVTAQIQHLFAYACKERLPKGESLLDPRFKLVKRGSASTWEKLSGRWATNKHYGRNILRLYKKLSSYKPAAGKALARNEAPAGRKPSRSRLGQLVSTCQLPPDGGAADLASDYFD